MPYWCLDHYYKERKKMKETETEKTENKEISMEEFEEILRLIQLEFDGD